MKKCIKSFFQGFVFLIVLILLFFLSMSLVMCIPNSAIQKNIDASLPVIEKEGIYYKVASFSSKSQLDNFTDRLMINKALADEHLNPFENAMSISGYPRYWHGYMVFLRPFFVFAGYTNFRYFNMIAFFCFLCIVFAQIKSKLGLAYSIAFTTSIVMAYSFIVPLSIQFSSVYYIMFIATILILSLYHKNEFRNKISFLFLALGATTNFFDLLTAPLLTLGIPLVLVVLLELNEDEKPRISPLFKKGILCSVIWVISYGFTWISKWTLGSLVLRKNVFKQAIDSSKFRVMGNEEYPLDRTKMFKSNFTSYFNTTTVKVLLLLLLIAIVFLVFFNKKTNLKYFLFFVIISIMPYAWFLAMSNHSQIHFWFTYRIQIITMFSLTSGLIFCYDKEKIKSKFVTLKEKRVQKSKHTL